jgi:hypothetical protein
LIAPETMASQTAIVLMLPSAVADFRATYGGFQTGVGLFLLVCAIRNTWIVPALTLQLFALGGFALGRAASIVVSGAVEPITLALLAVETGGFVAVAFALHAASPQPENQP